MATKSRYDEVKQFNGKRYTGMKVGRSHTWRYDPGEWKERKVTPDRWEFRYAVPKRRAGRAPEGSGAPVGTAAKALRARGLKPFLQASTPLAVKMPQRIKSRRET